MNPYNFAVLLFAFGTLFVGLLTLLKRKDNVAKHFFIFSIFVTLWGVGFSILTNSAATYNSALFGSRFANVSAVFIPISWIHFILVFLKRDEKKKKLIYFLYFFGLLIIAFSPTPLFVSGVAENLIPGFKWYTQAGPVYHIFTALFFLAVPYGFWEMTRALHFGKGKNRLQLQLFIVATLFGFVGGSSTFLGVYGIIFPTYGVFFMPIYPFLMAYAMIEHGLFDLEAISNAFQREKLATIGLLAASVNHETRNPLYAARGILENFKEGTKKSPEEVTDKALSQINRALDVITKLNRFSKPTSETIPSNSKASIQEALQNVFDLVSYEFELDKIKIINQIDPNLPSIQADQRQLEQILFNLIVNACHAMKKRQGAGGMAKEGILSLQSTIHNSRLTIEISDTGSGISQDQMKHLFEPFHTTKGENGTGLGLYITKRLIQTNNGKISVKSHVGKGTIFIIEFSRAQQLR